MICKARFPYGGHPCKYPAKYLVIAPDAPKAVCGYHSRQFIKGALIPLKLFRRIINIEQLLDIGFLEFLKGPGVQVSIEGAKISINLGKKEVHRGSH